MRAVLCSTFTGPGDLRIGEIDQPKLAGDEILIDVHAASVSFMDQLLVSGLYQMRPPTPFVPGTEASGVVVTVGEKVTKFAPGDRVACSSWTGGYAERMTAKESKSVRLPDDVAFETAATVLHNYGTAYYALVERARAQRGETAFVTGAAGGVGLAAVDLGRHLGLRVVAGVGSDDKAALVRDYGARDVINYRNEDLRERAYVLPSPIASHEHPLPTCFVCGCARGWPQQVSCSLELNPSVSARHHFEDDLRCRLQ